MMSATGIPQQLPNVGGYKTADADNWENLASAIPTNSFPVGQVAHDKNSLNS